MTALLERPASIRTLASTSAASSTPAPAPAAAPAPAPARTYLAIADPSLTTRQYNAALARYLRTAQPIGM